MKFETGSRRSCGHKVPLRTRLSERRRHCLSARPFVSVTGLIRGAFGRTRSSGHHQSANQGRANNVCTRSLSEWLDRRARSARRGAFDPTFWGTRASPMGRSIATPQPAWGCFRAPITMKFGMRVRSS